LKKPAREQILLTPQLVLVAAQQWWQNAGLVGGALAANPVYHHLGCNRLKGSVYSSVVGNTLQVQFSPDGTNFPNTQTLTADPNNANAFPFSFDLQYPYFRFVVTDSGGGSTVQIQAMVFEEGSGPTILGTGPVPPPPLNPNELPATYRVAFNGIVFSSAGGQFLELVNPVGSGRVVRATLQLLTKPSAQMHWTVLKQSVPSTVGTSTTPVPVSLDSADAATVGVVKLYTVKPTAGTAVGNIWDMIVNTGDTFGDQPGGDTNLCKPIVLRAGQSVAWVSDIAFTAQGVIEFTDAAS
jgi:hypothetical protein